MCKDNPRNNIILQSMFREFARHTVQFSYVKVEFCQAVIVSTYQVPATAAKYVINLYRTCQSYLNYLSNNLTYLVYFSFTEPSSLYQYLFQSNHFSLD